VSIVKKEVSLLGAQYNNMNRYYYDSNNNLIIFQKINEEKLLEYRFVTVTIQYTHGHGQHGVLWDELFEVGTRNRSPMCR